MMIVGVFIRFTHLDGKIYGNDEATTSVHVSGKTIVQYAAAMFDGRPRTAQQLLTFQKPDEAHGIRDVVQSLAVEDPQHPPLYYLLEREWERSAGSSVASRRILSAAFGAVTLLTAVWFGFELDSLLAGFVMGALVAASPFAIAYSQVAREYSLWLGLTFAASALFVRAARRGNKVVWIFYSIVSIAGLYTDALYILVIVAHALTLAVPSPGRRAATLGFAAALALMVAAYVPWIAALAYGYTHGIVTNNAYLAAGLSLKPFVLKWIFNVGTLFYDADYLYPKTALLVLPGFVALALAFVACARRLRRDPWLAVIFALSGVTFAALVLPDLLHHQQRSTASRYLVPLWVASYAALGVGLAMALRSPRAGIRAASLGFVLFTAATGFGSFAISVKHDTWWVDGSTTPFGGIARAIRGAKNPVVVYHSTWGEGGQGPGVWDFTVVMLANSVPPATNFVQYGRGEPFAMPTSRGSLLLLDPDDALLAAVRARGSQVAEIAGGSAAAASPEIAAFRKSVARERERQGPAASLAPTPSLWTVQER
jgi:uncharacterized membrane protein